MAKRKRTKRIEKYHANHVLRSWSEIRDIVRERDGWEVSCSRLEQLEKSALLKVFNAVVDDDELLQLVVDRMGESVLDVRTDAYKRNGKSECRFRRSKHGKVSRPVVAQPIRGR